MSKLLNDRMRKLDDTAFTSLKSNMTVDDYSTEEKALWDAKYTATRNRLKTEGKIRSDIFNKVVALAK